jgi:hypothetical protein
MKYLSRFKLFESKSEIKKLVSDIQDMCLELNDIEIHTDCEYHNIESLRKEYISLSIERELPDDLDDYTGDYLTSRWIDWSIVEDTVLIVLEYMKSNGWKPSYIMIDGENHNVEKLDVEKDFLHKFESHSPSFWGLQFDFIRF